MPRSRRGCGSPSNIRSVGRGWELIGPLGLALLVPGCGTPSPSYPDRDQASDLEAREPTNEEAEANLGTQATDDAVPDEYTTVPMPAAIAGHWRGDEAPPVGPSGEVGIPVVVELRLSDGRFVRTGYPAWDETAVVTRVSENGGVYTLELRDHVRNESPVSGETVAVTPSSDGQTLQYERWTLRREAP